MKHAGTLNDMLPKLYSIPEVCEALKVSRTTLHRLTERGEIYAYKVGNAVRYPAEAVTAYLNGTKFDPTTTGAPITRPDMSTYPPTPSLLKDEAQQQ